MTNQLPSRPNEEYLKGQAKGLLSAIKRGENEALQRLQTHHPLKAEFDNRKDTVKLADALLVVAREHGFESWPKLKNHIDDLSEKRRPLQNAIRDLQEGRCCILFDDEGRENEGDFVVAAEKVSAQTINFITKHGRGTVCLAMSEHQAKKLQITLVNPNRTALSEPAFLTAIDAAHGITTGVSAQDRAFTIQTAIAEDSSNHSVKSPGHVFPLLAHPEGLKARTGHTEGSIELMRLSGLKPAAVICEILKEDGSMARWDDLVHFAQENKIEMVRMSDLI